MRPLLERGQLAEALLVEDPPRVLVAEVVDTRPLPYPELMQRGRRQLGRERERLLIGTCCCEFGCGEEEDIEELATLNPARTISRLRRELREAAAADQAGA